MFGISSKSFKRKTYFGFFIYNLPNSYPSKVNLLNIFPSSSNSINKFLSFNNSSSISSLSSVSLYLSNSSSYNIVSFIYNFFYSYSSIFLVFLSFIFIKDLAFSLALYNRNRILILEGVYFSLIYFILLFKKLLKDF